MFEIGEAVIEDDIGHASFCCDLVRCKGACCFIVGGRGAPLEDDEVLEIQKAFPIVRSYLGEQSLRTIETRGLIEGSPGDYATTCVDQRECVFVVFEEGVARCSFEMAYNAGKLDWRKPLSCHLFPIRVRSFGSDHLRYEQIPECDPGRERGDRERIPLAEFLREPLERKFGKAWYRRLLDHVHAHVERPSDP